MGVKKIVKDIMVLSKNLHPEDFQTVANHYRLGNHEGSRHTMYYRAGYPANVAIPRHDPVKKTYVREFRDLIWDLVPDEWKEEN